MYGRYSKSINHQIICKYHNETFLNEATIQISMAVRIGGSKRKSRYKLKKDRRHKGKISVSRFMQTFKAGQRVHLGVEPSIHKGHYPLRYLGKTGIVKGSRGKCYEVAINDKGKEKLIIIHPVHLKTMSG